MNEKNAEIRIKFEIGDIKFEAEGSADLVERERSIFTNTLLPSAVEAVVRTRSVVQSAPYIETERRTNGLLLEDHGNRTTEGLTIAEGNIDYSQVSLASFVKKYGTLSEQDFSLFAAYFDELKNGTNYFTKDELVKYYDEARRTKPANISMSLNRLAQKGLIMDATDVEPKMPKPYRVSSEGIEYIKAYVPKEDKEKKTTKAHKPHTKSKSSYTTLNCDELNLDKYPEVKKFKDFKEKMMIILYIITKEEKGEWFTVSDVLCLMTDIFGEAATADQVNGVFRREKLWFKTEHMEGNGKEVKRKLLNKGIEYAESLTVDTQ